MNGSSAVRGASPAAAPPTSPHLSNQRPPTSTGTLKLPPLSPGEGWPHQPPRAAALAPSCPSCPSQTSVGRSANPWTQRWRSPPPSARLGGRLCSVSPSARPVRCCALLCSAVLPAAAGARCRPPGPPTAPKPSSRLLRVASPLPPPRPPPSVPKVLLHSSGARTRPPSTTYAAASAPIPYHLPSATVSPLHLTSSRRRLQHHPLPPSSRPIRPPQPSRTLLSISGADLNDAVQATAPAQRISTFPYHHRTAPPPDQRLASFASAKVRVLQSHPLLLPVLIRDCASRRPRVAVAALHWAPVVVAARRATSPVVIHRSQPRLSSTLIVPLRSGPAQQASV